MNAILALAGDAGCALGPGVVGLVMGETTLNSGLLLATLFPLLLAAGISRIRQNTSEIPGSSTMYGSSSPKSLVRNRRTCGEK
ncbi:MAG: hypothetical protein LBC46_00415 [Treponema sp.]|nr:hypothetical protein [Treponema sp.]